MARMHVIVWPTMSTLRRERESCSLDRKYSKIDEHRSDLQTYFDHVARLSQTDQAAGDALHGLLADAAFRRRGRRRRRRCVRRRRRRRRRRCHRLLRRRHHGNY